MNKYVRKFDDGINCVSFDVMRYMIEHASDYPTLEMADNAVSRYIAQKGKCAVTHEELSVGDMVCQHILPSNGERNDTYKNLILLSKPVSQLVLAESSRAIRSCLSKLSLTGEMQAKVNKLRGHRGLPAIQFEDYTDTKK